MSLVTDEIRASASLRYGGDGICQVKTKELLVEMGLPNGLLPLKDIVECGYVESTGFVWLIQKRKIEHRFEKIGKYVQCAAEITGYMHRKKVTKLTGVKAWELMMWLSISDICVDDPPTGKMTFKSPTGLSRSFPVSAFEIEAAAEDEEDEEEEGTAAAVKEAIDHEAGVKMITVN